MEMFIMTYPKYYIGALSKNIVDVLIDRSNSYSPGIIASRRQIDFDGGYCSGWSSQIFSSYIKSINPDILICRDHGGPGQGRYPDDGKQSFIIDSNIFDLIHIDPFLLSNSIEEAIDYTVHYIKLINNIIVI